MKRTKNLLYWLPRLISIAAIFFVSLFSLDVFSEHLSFWQQAEALAIHLLPSVALLIVLCIAWRYELLGGILFLLVGLALSPFIFLGNYRMNNSVWLSLAVILAVTFPFVLAGALFIASHYRRKRGG